MPLPVIGIGLALASAGLWGLGDYTGGLSVRHGRPFVVLLISALAGAVLLSFALLWQREPWPQSHDLFWAIAAGASSSLGLTALYTGLARGRIAVVASTTAVVGASLPVLFGFATHGLVKWPQLSGILIALLGLFLVTRADGSAVGPSGGFLLGVLGGLGISGFFIGMAQLSGGVLWPLLFARVAGGVVAALALVIVAQSPRGFTGRGWAVFTGLCDAGGNLFYVTALQHLRLELAAVLSSLYPAVTVLLAARFLHQRVTKAQWVGLILCLGGVALISRG